MNVGKLFYKKLSFQDLKNRKRIFLYAGNIPDMEEYRQEGLVGLSINKSDRRTILHDITEKMPLADESVECYQAEDVFEHIEYNKLVEVMNEIYRVLKKDGYFRLSIPDYQCDLLYERCLKNDRGEILFDECGGGHFVDGEIRDGGHVWFPTYKNVLALIEKSNFEKYKFYHYYDERGNSVTLPIDYSKGYVQRTPDHDERTNNPYRAFSIVVDLIK